MSKAWGVGAWALESERAEAEESERAAAEATSSSPAMAAATVLAGEPAQSFPSLKEAAATKPKKKKPVAVPLGQFATTYGGGGGGGRRGESLFEPRGLTPDEMLRLPTGPRERSQEELEYGRLGGGFRNYGGGLGGGARGGFPGRRSDDGDGSWGGAGGGRRSYGGFDEEPRRGPPARVSDLEQPSRADEVDNWAAGKKSFAPAPMDSGRSDRYSSLGGGGSSRADEVDNWAAGKKPLPSRYPSFGTGFRDSRSPTDSDRWGRADGGPQSNNGERPKIILDPPKGNVGAPSEPVRTRPSPFGAARPREEILAEKGVDWRKIDSDDSKKTSRPTSSHSSRPSSAQSSRPGSPGSQAAVDGAPKPRPKVNPFGDAKPREVLLQERGKDWRKIDMELEHRSVDRPETDEEKMLKEEISHLKALTKETEENQNGKSAQLSVEELAGLHEQILNKERDLELLIRQLDDKVRFGQRATGIIRPSSGAGRSDTSSTRPPSQSGLSEDSRSIDFVDRPRSRGGMGDIWSRPVDDRRGYQGGRERSFFDNRNMDRSKSRERW
ncbi:eukaryotic translation initiation factor 4B1-like [Phoenix dactylifera]|uniref:Eukaryotic translation initiation factor 4B1-like n=1 Tax=Phoenix dactylifera TaxID=42345 RepID=A0A8B9ATY1_PHODC|nr:eukaryotic translation initiation factor 4B1-like [Phoenix dactylifera]XP_038987353.1 eukaryotic translation initiation factor 4B1-like [Phoenix dactylifera]